MSDSDVFMGVAPLVTMKMQLLIKMIYHGLAVVLDFFLVVSEITSPERRPHILIGVCFTWSTSIWVLTLLSYYIRDWSYLYIAISAPCILFGILSIWWVQVSDCFLSYSHN